MPTPSAVFTELVTTTFRNHRKELSDNVTRNNAMLRRIAAKGRTRTESGGTTLTIPLEYAENATYQRYSGYDVLNIQASDVFTAAEFPWRQAAVNVTASGRELRINNGKERIINLAKSRIKNAMNTFANNMSLDLYSNGSLPNQVSGLQVLVSDNGQGTVGGIDSATWTFWRNRVQSLAAPIGGGGAIVLSPTTIEAAMLGLWLELVRGNDIPDLIVSSNDYYAIFEASQVSLKRYRNTTDVTAGLETIKYKSADVMFDGNSGIPTSRMYFLNTDYLEVVTHPDANMTVMEENTTANQDAVVIPVLWMGNLVTSNRSLQGVFRP